MSPCGCGGAGGTNSICHGFTGGVTAHQGHVVPSPRIVVIYWDQYFTDTPAAVTSMDQFVSDMASGGYWNGLGQYGVGSASVQGHVVINMKAYPTPNSQNPGASFSESQMQSQLVTWLNNGVVTPKPAGNEENLVYLIIAPSDTTLSLNGQTTGFCGYHQHGKYNASTSRDNLIWGTVHGYAKAATGQAFVDSISYCVSHELNEAFSNPDGQGHFNDNGCEIGDLCEAPANGPCCVTVPYVVSGRTWQVEKYWSNVDAACITGATKLTAAARSFLTCFGVGNTASRIYYLGPTRDVFEFAWQNEWVSNKLTGAGGKAANAPAAAAGSSLACFGVNGSASRVYYVGPNNNVYELFWSNGWGYNQLTGSGGKAAGAPSATQGSFLACFGVNGSASRVYYVGPNNNVYELFWSNGWGYNQLTGSGGKAAGAPAAAQGSALTCFGVNGSASRVYYFTSTVGANVNTTDVVELYWNNGWGYNKLTGPGGKAAGAPSALAGSTLACFGVNGSASRVYYLVNNLSLVDNVNDVYELYWDNGWGYNKLTGTGGKAANAPSALPSETIACFGVSGSASRVYYLGPKLDVFELAWENGWISNKLTGSAGLAASAPAAASGSALACFGVNGSASRVYYLGPTDHVSELAWDSGWFSKVL